MVNCTGHHLTARSSIPNGPTANLIVTVNSSYAKLKHIQSLHPQVTLKAKGIRQLIHADVQQVSLFVYRLYTL